MSWSNYEYKKPESGAKPGDYRCIIMGAKQTKSKSSGANMLEIKLRPSGTAANVFYYIVDNDYFDSNMSRFLDAFPELKEDFSIDTCMTWRGAMGAMKLSVNDDGYLRADRCIPSERAEKLPPFVWKARDDESQGMPERQTITELYTVDDDDELPFV